MGRYKDSLHTLIDRTKGSSLAKDSIWAVSGSVIGKGLALVAGIIIARFLGRELYGEYGLIKETVAYLAIVSTFGFGYTATKYVAEDDKAGGKRMRWLVRRIELFTLAFSLIWFAVLFIFAQPIAQFVKAPDLFPIFRKYGVIVVFNAISAMEIGVLSGLKLFKINAKVNCFSGITLFLASIALTYFYGLDGAVLALLLSLVVQVILNERYIRKALQSFPPENEGSEKDFRAMLSFSIPIALQEGLYVVVHWLTTYLLIQYAGYGEVGLVSAAATWSAVIIFIPGMLKNVMFSYLTTTDNHEHLVKRLLLFNLLSTACPVIIMIIFSRLICSFYGPTFSGLPIVLTISLVSAVAASVSEVFCYEFISRGHPWIVFLARIIRDSTILLSGWAVLSRVSHSQAVYMAIIGLVTGVMFLSILALTYRSRNRRYAK